MHAKGHPSEPDASDLLHLHVLPLAVAELLEAGDELQPEALREAGEGAASVQAAGGELHGELLRLLSSSVSSGHLEDRVQAPGRDLLPDVPQIHRAVRAVRVLPPKTAVLRLIRQQSEAAGARSAQYGRGSTRTGREGNPQGTKFGTDPGYKRGIRGPRRNGGDLPDLYGLAQGARNLPVQAQNMSNVSGQNQPRRMLHVQKTHTDARVQRSHNCS